MVQAPSRTDVAYGAVAGAVGVAGSYAAAGSSRSFVVAPIDAAVVRSTPGPIVAWIIENVGESGHLLHVALSVAIAVALLGATALAGLAVGRRLGSPLAGVGAAGLLGWVAATTVTGEVLLAAGAALPVAIVVAVGAVPGPTPDHDPARRRAIGAGVGLLGTLALAVGLGRVASEPRGQPSESSGSVPGSEGVDDLVTLADERSLDLAADDVPGLVSDIGEFYNVDIAQFDPDLAAGDWTLGFTGEVTEAFTVSFEDLMDMPVEHRFVTLRCVGESLNGRKMDTAVWTGTPIRPLLERADPAGECGCAMLHAEDGYFVQFPVSALDDAFLAWGMNGQPLPRSHGRPVRVLVPGHWGETNVKWLSEIELLDEAADGYWEERGWHGTGPVETVAKLWDVTELEDGRVELAGHAYAGTRGIDRVEVSTDGGETWTEAELSEPLPGEDVWRQWRHVFTPEGTHEAVVRAVDGDGILQPEEESDSFPSGATGWVSRTVQE